MHDFLHDRRWLPLLRILCLVLPFLMPQGGMAADIPADIRTFTDPSRNLTLAEILALDETQFTRTRRSDVNFGYTRNAIWLRIAITGDSDRRVLLSLFPNFVDLIDIYAAPPASGTRAEDFTHVATGDHRPLPADGLSGLYDAAALDLAAGKTTLAYVRLAAIGSSVTADVRVYPAEERPRRETLSNLAIGMWFGAMAILIVIQLVFFHYDRKARYPLLAAATLAASLVYTGTLGLSRVFLFPGGGDSNDTFVSMCIWIGLSASALAAVHILELKGRNPWMHRIFLAFIALGALGTLFGMLGYHLAFAPFGSMAGILLATLGAFQGLRTANLGGNATRLRAAAYCVLWAGVVTIMLQRTAVIDLPNWVTHAYAVACVLQTVLLTAALGVRLRAAEALNLVMQQQALHAAKAASDHANRLVEERTRELAAARQTAEEALRAELSSQRQQVRFMEVISHQYRTPLAAIRTHVDNIGLSLPRADEANHARLDRVRKGIQRLVEVLEVNLSRARLQGPSFAPMLVRTPLIDIIDAAAARGRDLLQNIIDIDIAPDAAGLRIRADADMLGLAIINLLENAVKFGKPGNRAPVVLSCRLEDGKALIAVSDRGIGIPAAEIGQIFDPAHRGVNADAIEGSGVGLSLVARIAAAHGGSVRAESVLEQGTTITILLPLAPAG